MLKNYIILIIFILIVDYIWLSLQKPLYNILVRSVQGTDLKMNLIGGILSYICIIASLILFVIPLIKSNLNNNQTSNLFGSCLYYGGLLGLLMYGIFNATNLAIFTNYDPKIALMDTLWGATLFTMSTFLFFNL